MGWDQFRSRRRTRCVPASQQPRRGALGLWGGFGECPEQRGGRREGGREGRWEGGRPPAAIVCTGPGASSRERQVEPVGRLAVGAAGEGPAGVAASRRSRAQRLGLSLGRSCKLHFQAGRCGVVRGLLDLLRSLVSVATLSHSPFSG